MSIRGDITWVDNQEIIDTTLYCRRHKVRGGFSEEFRQELIQGSRGLSVNAFIEYAYAKISHYEALANQPEYSI